jgi:phosphoglycerate dehydrogenase-like enzyme
MKVAYHASFPGFEPAAKCEVEGASFHTANDLTELARLAHGSEALLILATDYSQDFANAIREPGGRLRFIQFLSAGYESAGAHGVPPGVALSNASEVWAPVVAEHAVALVLALVRRVPDLERRRQARRWDRPAFNASLSSLDGSRVALLGYGSIGREIAKRIRPFGAHVVGISRSARDCPLLDEAVALSELRELLPTVDILINVLPASPSTAGFVDGDFLTLMKPGSYFVNVGRGATVDEAALADALRRNLIAGAALDVFEREPLDASSPLWSMENAILSPHAAGYGSPGIVHRAHELCQSNLRALRDGTKLRNLVTPGAS